MHSSTYFSKLYTGTIMLTRGDSLSFCPRNTIYKSQISFRICVFLKFQQIQRASCYTIKPYYVLVLVFKAWRSEQKLAPLKPWKNFNHGSVVCLVFGKKKHLSIIMHSLFSWRISHLFWKINLLTKCFIFLISGHSQKFLKILF